MRIVLVIAALAASVLWGLGRMLGERGVAASLLFYLPAPLVLLGLGLAVFLLRNRRRLALGVAALAILPLAATVAEQQWRAPTPQPLAGPELNLLHWNVCRGYGGWERIAREIASGNPDLVILSEVMSEADGEELARLLPELPHRQYGFPMLVLSRFPLDPITELESRGGVRIYELALHRDAETWRFFALDIAGQPTYPREPAILDLEARLHERRPDFLAGDFNTPRQSRLLSPLAPGYRHAYDLAGRGWSYTWPTFLPVLSLDHLFVGPKVAVASYEIATSPWSDHRLQRARLRRQPAAP